MPIDPTQSTSTGASPSPDVLVTMSLHVLASLAMALVIAWTYRATHRRDTTYAPTFTTTLVLLAVLITVVTQVIGDSVARAFSLVGALSIVRFRTVVADTRDTAFVIFAVVIGMAAGTGHLSTALIGLAGGCLTAALMYSLTKDSTVAEGAWKLVIRIALGSQSTEKLEAALKESVDAFAETGSSTSRQGAAMDLTYEVRLRTSTRAAEVVSTLNRLEGVVSVSLDRV